MCVRGSSENLIDVRALHLLCGDALGVTCVHKANVRYTRVVCAQAHARTRVSPR